MQASISVSAQANTSNTLSSSAPLTKISEPACLSRHPAALSGIDNRSLIAVELPVFDSDDG
jgi:hypothetical protein